MHTVFGFRILGLLLVSCYYFVCSTAIAQSASVPYQFVPWDNVRAFAIHPKENYMVLSLEAGERLLLFESMLEGNTWSEPLPLDVVNNYGGGNASIGGVSFNYNASVLYYHANFEDAKGGYDIYYSNRTPNGWSAPKTMEGNVNTQADELYPIMGIGNDKFFFSRSNPDADARKPRRSPDCQILYASYKMPDGSWEMPAPLHDAINKACEYGMFLAQDGRTIFFSSVDQDNHRDGYNIYHAKIILKGTWVLPGLIESIASDETLVMPRMVGSNFYFLNQSEGRRGIESSIYVSQLDAKFYPLDVINSQGVVLDEETQQPLKSELKVFDPTTLKVLGTFYSNEQSGEFSLPLLDGENYIVDVRKPGYSFASFQLDYRRDERILAPETIALFQETELVLSVYDGEIFRPLDAQVWVEVLSDNNRRISATKLTEGEFVLHLPIGHNYSVHASSSGFKDNQFDFNILGDVIFSRFQRSLPLDPIKREVEILIADSESGDGVNADILITNLNREETIFFSAQDVQDGKVVAHLREGDEYEFTIRGAQGYSFHNEVFDVSEEQGNSFGVELVSLRAQTSIRLNNINFGSNSADLTSESFAELDRVVDLIFTNPLIVMEISAHTDNVGSDAYNLMLSERRAQSVVNYLLENDVPSDRIVAKGYGLRNPMVSNDSDENRALNRRVEFKILEIRDEVGIDN